MNKTSQLIIDSVTNSLQSMIEENPENFSALSHFAVVIPCIHSALVAIRNTCVQNTIDFLLPDKGDGELMIKAVHENLIAYKKLIQSKTP